MNSRQPLRRLILLFLISALASHAASAKPWKPKLPWQPKPKVQIQRIVTLGDSITDGNTYQLLISQGFYDALKPVPILTNAGIGGDTISGMRARLDRDVISYHPYLVTIMAGAGDADKNVSADAFEVDLDAILDRLQAEQIKIILLTTSIYGPTHSDQAGTMAKYNEIVHEAAAQRHVPVAEVNAMMRKAVASGTEVMESDDIHPNFEGQRIIARAILDAMGSSDVAVPDKLRPLLMPGVIGDWKLRLAPDTSPLTQDGVKALKPDGTWVNYNLPEATKAPGWLDQERLLGFAVSTATVLGADKPLQGVATVMNDDKDTRQVYFNTGAQLQSIWLNGIKIYQSLGWTGWHAGKERVAGQLAPGANTVVIESDGQFFLSVTDTNTW